jgi:hypothetical protein
MKIDYKLYLSKEKIPNEKDFVVAKIDRMQYIIEWVEKCNKEFNNLIIDKNINFSGKELDILKMPVSLNGEVLKDILDSLADIAKEIKLIKGEL